MSPVRAGGTTAAIALATLAACQQSSTDTSDDKRMAQAMRKVEVDQAKSDKLVLERADEETKRDLKIQRAIGKR
jgi:hypothetical protein